MVTTTKYVWDPVFDCVTHELDENNAVKAVYHNEPQQYGGVLSQRRGNTSHYHHHDALGSTRFLTDSAGTVTDTYLNDAWGNSVASTGTTVNPFRWVGKYGYYTDNSTGQVYIRARMYQPTVARWTSVDPIGFFDGMNRYQAVSTSPLQILDPTGLLCNLLSVTTTGPTNATFEDEGSNGVRISFTTEILFFRPCCDCEFRQYFKCNYDIAFIFPNGTVIQGPRPDRRQSQAFEEDCGDLNHDGQIQPWECYGGRRPSILRPKVGVVDKWTDCRYWMKDEPADAYFFKGAQDLLEDIARSQEKRLPKPLPRGIKVKLCMSCAFRQVVTDTATGNIVWRRVIDAGIPFQRETQRTVCRTDPLIIR